MTPEVFEPSPRIPKPGDTPLSEDEMAALPPRVRDRIKYLEKQYAELSSDYHRQSDRLRKANWGNWSRSR